MATKRTVVVLLAICLTAGAVLMMFPGWMLDLFPNVDFSNTVVDFDELSMYNFPFYGSARHSALAPAKEGEEEVPLKYGVSDIAAKYASYINKQTDTLPNLGEELETIAKQDGFFRALYTFLMVSFLTIPVYMVLRLLLLNTLYGMSKVVPWLFRLFWNGAVAVCASAITTFATWFLYRTFLYELTFNIIFEKLKQLIDSTLALYSLGGAMMIVVAFLVIWLIRATVFRGSVFTSLVGAIMRTLLFIVLIAVISAFVFNLTLYTAGIIAGALLAVGLIKTIFLAEK